MTTTMRQILIAATLSMMWPGATSAVTGFQLQGYCRSGSARPLTSGDLTEHSRCVGYIVGVNDILVSGLDDPDFCIPNGVNGGFFAQVVLSYLDRNPATLHLTAAGLINNGRGW